MTYGFLDTLTTQAVRAAQDANGVGGFWEEMRSTCRRTTRGGLHCRTRQLLHGQHLGVLAGRISSIEAGPGASCGCWTTPGPGLHRIRRKPPVADGRKRLGRGPRGPLP